MTSLCPICGLAIHVVTAKDANPYYTGGCIHAQIESSGGVVSVGYPDLEPKHLAAVKRIIGIKEVTTIATGSAIGTSQKTATTSATAMTSMTT